MGSRGFHLEGGAGDLYRIATANDNWQGPNRYVSQAYVILKPFTDLPLRIEAGKFYSSIGAESAQNYSEQNFNVSGSLLFWYGGPLYHIGVRALLPINSTWTVGAQLLSGSNTITGAHGHQSMAYSVSRSGQRWGWTQGYLGGNQKFDGRGWRQISDTIGTLKVVAAAACLRRSAGCNREAGHPRTGQLVRRGDGLALRAACEVGHQPARRVV